MTIMRRMNLLAAPALLASAFAAFAQQRTASLPPGLVGVGLDQKLNQPVPLDLTFRDETGAVVPLRRFFSGRPVILSLVYYQCPMLCTLVLNGLVRSLRGIELQPGRDFEIVTVSFNPKDTPQLAAAKKGRYVEQLGRQNVDGAWHFLTGEELEIAELTKAAGFHYRFDAKSGQYAHPSAIIVLTPDGRISRYFYGVDYPARDLRLGLVEASAGKVGSKVDQILLFCYHYDPATGRYGVVVWNIIRALSYLTVVVLGLFLWKVSRRGRHRHAVGV
jgi:protein SCO1